MPTLVSVTWSCEPERIVLDRPVVEIVVVVVGVAVVDMGEVGAELVVGQRVGIFLSSLGSAMRLSGYSKTGSRGSPFANVSASERVTTSASRTSRRCPCGPDPSQCRSAPGSCLRAGRACRRSTSRSSSVSWPHFSLTLPLTCFQLPSTRFQSMRNLLCLDGCMSTFLIARRFLKSAERQRLAARCRRMEPKTRKPAQRCCHRRRRTTPARRAPVDRRGHALEHERRSGARNLRAAATPRQRRRRPQRIVAAARQHGAAGTRRADRARRALNDTLSPMTGRRIGRMSNCVI